jgi:hypothetical protein
LRRNSLQDMLTVFTDHVLAALNKNH